MSLIPGLQDIANALTLIRDAILSFINSVSQFFTTIAEFLQWLGVIIVSTIGRAVDELANIFRTIGDQLVGFFTWLGTRIVDAMWSALQPMIHTMWRAIETGERIVSCAFSQVLVNLHGKLVKLIYFNFLMVGVEISMRMLPRIVERSSSKGFTGMIGGIFWGLASIFFTPMLTMIPASMIVSYLPRPSPTACLEIVPTTGLGGVEYKPPTLPASPPQTIGGGTIAIGVDLYDGSVFRHTDAAAAPTTIIITDDTGYLFVE
jgi:hypothetical protein